MIILKCIKGGLANVLIGYAQHLNYCLKNNIELKWNIPFKYARYFKEFNKGFLINYFRYIFNKYYLAIYVLLVKIGFCQNTDYVDVWFEGTHVNSKFKNSAKNKTLILDTGMCGCFSLYNNFEAVKEKFYLTDKYQKKLDKLVAKYKADNEFLVGVHVRHGDYKHWKEGKYYLEADVYGKYMKELNELLPKNKKIKFIVCTDDKRIKIEDFNQPDLNIEFNSKNQILDMYVLASCDYILGPFSTYCSWASYWGQVPKFEISKETEGIKSLEELKIFNK